MKNIALTLAYDGTNYHGWQSQINARTVSDTIGFSIKRLTGEKISLTGCGRTDSGVHAKIYVANFRSETNIPLDRFPYAVNSFLPDDISVFSAKAVPDMFHSTFSCRGKEYTYLIYSSKARNPFYKNRAYHYPLTLSFDKMCEASKKFEGTHDFSSVRSTGTDVKTTVRTINWCKVEQIEGKLISISISADGFLYNMARTIAGTILCSGRGSIKPEEIPSILKSGDRSLAGPTLPPEGLYLTRLWYDKEVTLEDSV